MKALILAAGYGTRLYPLSKNMAKALLPVGGRPMVEHIIKKMTSIPELDEIFMVVNKKFYGDFEKWLSSYKAETKIGLFNDGSIDDDNKLGAIGDIRFAIGKGSISDDLLIIAGDNLFNFELVPFVRFFNDKGSSVGLYRVNPMELVKKYSVVELDENQKLLSFEEKPAEPRTNLIAICLYLFPGKKLNMVSRYIKEGNNPDAPGHYIKWLVDKEQVYGFTFDGKWLDIGDFKSYEEANRIFG